MNCPPTGTITFLFTDIEGSSKMWERHPDAMRAALAQHDRLLHETFEAHGGYVFKTVGDAFCVAFAAAQDALAGAVTALRALRRTPWEGIGEIKVRMALHTGTAEMRDCDYFGQSLNRVARILSVAHGGQVLLSLPTQELVRDLLPGGVQLRALGEHRLRDLARPEHLYQIAASDLPSHFPALLSLESVPNNLPVQLTSFIGRERELTEVRRLLGSTRLLTLTGPGGTGKTRLSLQVAADLLDRYPDGIWFMEFAMITDPARVVESVAATLNLRQDPERPLAVTLASFASNKQFLLVFDNCEHLITACAQLAEMLLRSCPQVRILASSREPMGIAGETAWPVPSLSLPAQQHEKGGDAEAIERLLQYEAVGLFIDRASIARPAFRLTDEDVQCIAQICWRLDGIPLALELAAARVRVLSLQQILERLDDRFHLLTTGHRTAVPRQQTLRALIDWSYDLLTEPERELFRRLSIFPHGRSLEAIEAVCSDGTLQSWEIVDLIGQLVDKSLVYVEKTPRHGTRYFLLESITQYASEKLVEAGERETFQLRHLDYFMNHGEECSRHLCGPEQREWLGRAALEEHNVHQALETSLERPGYVTKGLRLWTAVQRHVVVRGLFKEAREHGDKLLAHPEAAPRDAIRARGLAAAGYLAWVADDMTATHLRHTEALAIFRELGDAGGVAQALADLALHTIDARDISRARTLLEEAIALTGGMPDSRVTAHVQHVRAVLAAEEGDFVLALAQEEESLAIYRKTGDLWHTMIIAWCVGINAMALGHFDRARELFAGCLQTGLDLGNYWGTTFPLDAFATLAVAEGRYELAARIFGASEAQRTRLGIFPQPPAHQALRAVMNAATNFQGAVIEAARQQGRELDFDAALALALERDER